MQFLLPLHIIAGSIALIGAALAVLAEKGKLLHINAGKTYFWGMLVIFGTAIPMSILTGNIFLALIAFFSFYLAFAGRRFASNRKGIAATSDWVAVGLMFSAGIGMWLLAATYFMQGNSQYVVLIVFGLLALSLGYADFKSYQNKTATGKQRIARHLSNMLGGTIAVITAVLVVNVDVEPRWIFWLLPTALITPVILWWKARVLNPGGSRGIH